MINVLLVQQNPGHFVLQANQTERLGIHLRGPLCRV